MQRIFESCGHGACRGSVLEKPYVNNVDSLKTQLSLILWVITIKSET